MKKPRLTPAERLLLQEYAKHTQPRLTAPRSQNKGYTDTPLFRESEERKQTSLF